MKADNVLLLFAVDLSAIRVVTIVDFFFGVVASGDIHAAVDFIVGRCLSYH